jgi:cobalt-zinc-cadmium resistance protein CzcA
MAVPLAAIGGVFSLWARGMPFSISAGVGFIVLFGVAVLNGLVLISRFNDLKDNAIMNLRERILMGAKERVRPVLLTATAAIMGFLPMAISASAGAEVQRPLATVVIGGLITATILTLLVVPVLYYIVEKRKIKREERKMKKLSVNPVIVLLFAMLSIFQFSDLKAQEIESKTVLSLDQAINIGLSNNGNILAAKTNIEIEYQGRKAAFNPGKTGVDMLWGQYNSFEKDFAFEISQQFEFPAVYAKQKKLANARITGSELELRSSENNLKREIRKAWYQLSYLLEQRDLMIFQDSLYGRFYHAATIRYETEATNYLEFASAETQVMEIQNALRFLTSDISIQQEQLRILLNDSVSLIFKPDKLIERKIDIVQDSDMLANNPLLAFAKQQTEVAMAEKAVKSAQFAPDFSFGYFNQSLLGSETASGGIANGSDRFWGLKGSIIIPVFFGSYKANVETAKLKMVIAQTKAIYYNNVLSGEYEQQLQEVLKFRGSLSYYQEKAVPQADLIIENAQKSFENGAINYVEYFLNVNAALKLKFNYLNTLNGYNQSVINLEYLIGY